MTWYFKMSLYERVMLLIPVLVLCATIAVELQDHVAKDNAMKKLQSNHITIEGIVTGVYEREQRLGDSLQHVTKYWMSYEFYVDGEKFENYYKLQHIPKNTLQYGNAVKIYYLPDDPNVNLDEITFLSRRAGYDTILFVSIVVIAVGIGVFIFYMFLANRARTAADPAAQ